MRRLRYEFRWSAGRQALDLLKPNRGKRRETNLQDLEQKARRVRGARVAAGE